MVKGFVPHRTTQLSLRPGVVFVEGPKFEMSSGEGINFLHIGHIIRCNDLYS